MSDVIVRGNLTYRWIPEGADGGDSLSGEIVSRRVDKGPRASSYRVQQSVEDFYCSGFGWEPAHEPRAYRGRFFLKRSRDGSYIILRYEQ